MNKNIFAFALCFSAFTAQANDDSVDNKNEKIVTITIESNDGSKEVNAKVVTPEQAAQIFNMSADEESSYVVFIDEITFSINDIFYVIQTANKVSESTDATVDTQVTMEVITDSIVDATESAEIELNIVNENVESQEKEFTAEVSVEEKINSQD